MPSLWLTGVSSEAAENPLPTLKAIRQVLRWVVGSRAGIEDAEVMLREVSDTGVAHLGDFAAADVEELQGVLDAAGCSTGVDIDPDSYVTKLPTSEDKQDEGIRPTKAAYQTAMVLMANMDGNPLRAASVAVGLARTTGEEAFYTEVVASMILTFPWLEAMLRAQQLLD